ncbi:hypothetical protein GW17_00031326 [Ensete ventricosum]|nr:hypothetical protein GW17_00031326 [Ensete ventricosum]RZS28636.1 hypothetical protein BHM03_00062270 [Ensete ventricosum]
MPSAWVVAALVGGRRHLARALPLLAVTPASSRPCRRLPLASAAYARKHQPCSRDVAATGSSLGASRHMHLILVVKRATNWTKGSSLFWLNPRSNAAIGLGQALARKFSSNSLESWSKLEIEESLSWLYHIRASPRRVVRNARHIRAPEVP